MRSKYPATFAFLTVSALLLAVPAVSVPAQAQSTTALGGVGEIQTITARAKVQAVNLKTRDVTLMNQSGETVLEGQHCYLLLSAPGSDARAS